MANEEHLNILKQGVTMWNKRRKENPDVKPDLHRGNLKGANLTGANLSEADLTKANLRKANLQRANFVKANLHGEEDFSEEI